MKSNEENQSLDASSGSDNTPKTSVKKKPARKKTARKKTAKRMVKREFPHDSVEESLKIPNSIKEYNAGNPWSPDEIAKALGVGKGNKFYYLTASARDYGLTVGTRDSKKIELDDLGKKVAYPKSASEEYESAKAAFLNIALFKRVYEYYQGGNLPEIQYLKNTLKTEFGVDETKQDEFYEIYQRNLKYVESLSESTSNQNSSGASSKISDTSSIFLGESKSAGDLIAFVAMPFSEKTDEYPSGYFDEVLKHLITPAAVNADFNARTAKKSGSEVIQSTIVNDLDAADLVIVDLSEHNPNVLFELGMRIAFNKPVCLIRAKGTAPIFDIDHMLRVYDYNPCLWPSTLEKDIPSLTDHIRETWNNRDQERSYLSILRENK